MKRSVYFILKSIILFNYFLIVLGYNQTAIAQEIKKPIVVVGGDYDFPPYSFIDEAGKPSGFSTDLTLAIAKEMGFDVQFKLDKWAIARSDLEKGVTNIIQEMAYSIQRDSIYDFTIPYDIATHTIFIKKGMPYISVKDLKNKSIVVTKGDIGHDYIVQNAITRNITIAEDYTEMLKLLITGKYDCAMMQRIPGLYWAEKIGIRDQIEAENENFITLKIGYSVMSGENKILPKFNEGLAILKENGKFNEIYQKWFQLMEPKGIPSEKVIRYILMISIPLFILLLLASGWSWSLKYQVKKRTQEIEKQHTELQTAHKQLKESEKSLKAIVNSLDDVIFEFNPHYIYANIWTANESILFKPSNDVIGKSIFEVLPQNLAEILKDAIDKVLKNGEIISLDYTSPIDQNIWYNAKICPLRNETGEIKSVTALIRDISLRKDVEIELMHAKIRAEESDKLKSAFLANMSHEIRTPLNSIIGFSDLLKEELQETNNSVNYLELIIKSGNQLLNLINDIIDLSKIEANQLIIKPNAFSLNSLITELTETFKIELTERGKNHINIFEEEDLNDEECFVKQDEFRIRQILTNLMSNAVKFTDNGSIEIGYKKISTEELTILRPDIKSFDTPEFILFYVKDSGIGIPVEKHRVIFERFRQIDETDSRNYGGTGLGLAISKRLVELMKGTIWFESEKNKGACFYFTVPYIKCDYEDIKKINLMQNISYFWNDKVILLVEDKFDSSFLIEKILRKTKAKVLLAQNGIEAVEICRTNPSIDVVLMDIQLPVLNGFEATKRIKEIRKDLPIIAQTASAFAEDRDKCISAGCDYFITKPIIKEQLLSALNKYLD